jgi:hypothetical protein
MTFLKDILTIVTSHKIVLEPWNSSALCLQIPTLKLLQKTIFWKLTGFRAGMVAHACARRDSGGWHGRITWSQEYEASLGTFLMANLKNLTLWRVTDSGGLTVQNHSCAKKKKKVIYILLPNPSQTAWLWHVVQVTFSVFTFKSLSPFWLP